MKSVNSADFFKQVALNSGLSDLQTIKNVYYGMVRTISRELRGRQIVDLPDLGRFLLVTYKSRKCLNVSSREVRIIPPKVVIRFQTDRKIRKYFREWSEMNKKTPDN